MWYTACRMPNSDDDGENGARLVLGNVQYRRAEFGMTMALFTYLTYHGVGCP